MKKRNLVLGGFNAFTLAEVLITLVIIGVIGALTVPALIQNTQKQEYVSALKKAYSTLSNAVNQITAEEGSPKSSCAECKDGWAYSPENVAALLKKHLNVIKDCGGAQGCFGAKQYFNIPGYGQGWNDIEVWDKALKFITADGMSIGVNGYFYPMCNQESSGYNDICLTIYVDINGKKGPNVYGRDFFPFLLRENGLHPAGCNTPSCGRNLGSSCTCKVLTEGAMNY